MSAPEHTVHVEAYGAQFAPQGPDDERLVDLMEALSARPELLGPSVSANLSQQSIGVTVTIEADDEQEAHRIAAAGFGQELVRLGFAQTYLSAGMNAGQAVIVPA